MADTIERLYKLTVDGGQAARDLNAIAKSTADMDKRMADSINTITRFGKALAGVASVHEVVAGFKSIIDSMDQLGKDAQKIGVGADELQRLRYAADFAGVGAEKMNAAIAKLAVGMGDLSNKTSKAGATLRAAGVTNADSAEQALGKLADRFASMPDGVVKTAEAVAVFGKAIGPDLIPFLNQGAEGIKKVTDEADRFGGVVSAKTIQAASAFNDNLERLERVSKGAGAQLVEGMLPALVAITNSLADATKKGDGFVSAGQEIGKVLANVAGYAIKTTATLEAFYLVLVAISNIRRNPFNVVDALKAMKDGIDAIDKDANDKLTALRAGFERAQAAFPDNPRPSTNSAGKTAAQIEQEARDAAAAAAKASRDAAAAERERKKANDEMWKSLIEQAKAEELAQKAMDSNSAALSLNAQSILKVDQARKGLLDDRDKQLDAIEAEGARLQALMDMYEEGTPELKAWAAAQLVAGKAAQGTTTTLVKQRDELDAFNDALNSFIDDAANSAGHLSAAFKKMAETIVAELLKIWAKRYILDAIFGASTGGSAQGSGIKVPNALGNAYDGGKVVPFARGGVISRPIVFPMALAGEAGPEAILPLQRAANGSLGVQSVAPQMNVTVHNYADATVTTRQTGPNDLEVIVEKTRQAIASDLRSGGNMVSRSLEQAYGIGRGAAAAF